MMRLLPLVVLLALGCDAERAAAPETTEGPAAPAPPAPVAAPSDEGERHFGAPLAGEREVTPLAALIDAPDQYAGTVVRTEGEISAVCQRMGCWMELRDGAGRPVRVPMAGHSFFLPRDVSGRRALVEGPVALRPLGDAEREHLAGEGAEATDVALELSATSVVIRDATL